MTTAAKPGRIGIKRKLAVLKRKLKALNREAQLARAMATLPKLLAAARKPENQATRLAALRKSAKAKEASRRNQKRGAGRVQITRPEITSLTAGPNHIAASWWHLSNPAGRIYQFRNLAHFIRENTDLFEPEDVQWVRRGRGMNCRAFSGIASLRPYNGKGQVRKSVEGSWHGWTWLSTLDPYLPVEPASSSRVQKKAS